MECVRISQWLPFCIERSLLIEQLKVLKAFAFTVYKSISFTDLFLSH